MKLAIAQIVSGLLITVFSFISTRWGFPTQFNVPMPEPVPEGVEPFVMVSVFLGLGQALARISAFVAIVLGLVVLGVGIVQLVKARRLIQ